MNKEKIKNIQSNGKTARGKSELIKHLEGKRLTLKQAINAHCYDCMGYFADGKVDCEMPACPLHPVMSYNVNKGKRPKMTVPVNKEKEMIEQRL